MYIYIYIYTYISTNNWILYIGNKKCLIIFFSVMLVLFPKTALQAAAVMLVANFANCQDSNVDSVGEMISRIVKQDFATCHLSLFTTEYSSPLFSIIRRFTDSKRIIITPYWYRYICCCRNLKICMSQKCDIVYYTIFCLLHNDFLIIPTCIN